MKSTLALEEYTKLSIENLRNQPPVTLEEAKAQSLWLKSQIHKRKNIKKEK